ncbi:MAG: class I SAM-dependent methyltransferase [Acutalibacteraceae bacterium]
MDNTNKFCGKAEIYAKSRPNYSPDLIEHLIKKLNKDMIIADVGSGTGKLSAEFLKRGYTVFCVEPNKDMREMSEKILSKYNRFNSVNGTDTNTTLQNNSIDLVTVAQAFHWFDTDGFKAECKRILKPDGIVAIIYNHRVMGSDFVNENAEICKRYCPDFKGFSNKLNSDAMTRISLLFNGKYETVHFDNDLEYNKELFVKRMLSASYSPTPTDANYSKYMVALEDLFDKYSENDILILPNETVAYIGKV